MIPADPFERISRPLATLRREERVALLDAAAYALLEDRAMEADARLILRLALRCWLNEGGDLDRHLGISTQRSSYRAPASLRQRLVMHLTVTACSGRSVLTYSLSASCSNSPRRAVP